MKKWILATMAFWGLTFAGPGLLFFWNRISGMLVAGYQEGSLGFFLLQLAAKPLSLFLGYSAAKAILDGKYNLCLAVNLTGALIWVLYAVIVLSQGERKIAFYGDILSGAVCIGVSLYEIAQWGKRD